MWSPKTPISSLSFISFIRFRAFSIFSSGEVISVGKNEVHPYLLLVSFIISSVFREISSLNSTPPHPLICKSINPGDKTIPLASTNSWFSNSFSSINEKSVTFFINFPSKTTVSSSINFSPSNIFAFFIIISIIPLYFANSIKYFLYSSKFKFFASISLKYLYVLTFISEAAISSITNTALLCSCKAEIVQRWFTPPSTPW